MNASDFIQRLVNQRLANKGTVKMTKSRPHSDSKYGAQLDDVAIDNIFNYYKSSFSSDAEEYIPILVEGGSNDDAPEALNKRNEKVKIS